MSLPDQDTSMVDTFSQTELVNAGLQSSLQEVFHLESQHVVELHAGLIKDANTDETTDKRIAFKKSFGILFVESE